VVAEAALKSSNSGLVLAWGTGFAAGDGAADGCCAIKPAATSMRAMSNNGFNGMLLSAGVSAFDKDKDN
jgi:hypothetical protein